MAVVMPQNNYSSLLLSFKRIQRNKVDRLFILETNRSISYFSALIYCAFDLLSMYFSHERYFWRDFCDIQRKLMRICSSHLRY